MGRPGAPTKFKQPVAQNLGSPPLLSLGLGPLALGMSSVANQLDNQGEVVMLGRGKNA